MVPLTIMICSCAVRECQGTTHPEGAFRINVEGPVAGLPVSMADDRHLRRCPAGTDDERLQGAHRRTLGKGSAAGKDRDAADQGRPGRTSRRMAGQVDQELGLGQGGGRDPQDRLYPTCSELDRLGFRFRQTGIADADLVLRGRGVLSRPCSLPKTSFVMNAYTTDLDSSRRDAPSGPRMNRFHGASVFARNAFSIDHELPSMPARWRRSARRSSRRACCGCRRASR